MSDAHEFALKRRRIADLIESLGLSGLLFGRSASWSWASCGREANVATNSETAVAGLLFTPRRDYLLAVRTQEVLPTVVQRFVQALRDNSPSNPPLP